MFVVLPTALTPCGGGHPRTAYREEVVCSCPRRGRYSGSYNTTLILLDEVLAEVVQFEYFRYFLVLSQAHKK
jgi:hypothetical protein